MRRADLAGVITGRGNRQKTTFCMFNCLPLTFNQPSLISIAQKTRIYIEQAENPVLRTEEGRGRGLGVDAFGRDFSSNRWSPWGKGLSTAEIACARAKACFLLHKTNLV